VLLGNFASAHLHEHGLVGCRYTGRRGTRLTGRHRPGRRHNGAHLLDNTEKSHLAFNEMHIIWIVGRHVSCKRVQYTLCTSASIIYPMAGSKHAYK
jgi:hypothetical protein